MVNSIIRDFCGVSNVIPGKRFDLDNAVINQGQLASAIAFTNFEQHFWSRHISIPSQRPLRRDFACHDGYVVGQGLPSGEFR